MIEVKFFGDYGQFYWYSRSKPSEIIKRSQINKVLLEIKTENMCKIEAFLFISNKIKQ